MTDNKEIIDEKRFSEILEILNILKENNYENISEEHYTQFNSALSYARSERNKQPPNGKPFDNLAITVMSVSERQKKFNEKIDGSDPDGFLNRHFTNLEKEYQISTLPSSEIEGCNKVEYQELQPFDFMPQTELKREENKEYYQKAEDILEKLKEANPFFKEALKDKEVNFKILEGDKIDGKFCYNDFIKSKGKTVTINLDSSLFAGSDKDKEMLPMVIAHEFGHFIDVAKRPLGYTGMLQDKQEFFADIIGAKMATNAGYEKSITAFKEYLDLCSTEAPLLKSRAQLLDERYPETKTEQNTKINSDRKEMIDDKQFSDILEEISTLKEKNYENISDENFENFDKALEYAKSKYPQNKEPFNKLANTVTSASRRQKEFNEDIDHGKPDKFLNQHFDNIEKKYQISPLPSSEFEEYNNAEYKEMYPFDFMPRTELKKEENKEYYQKADDILEKLKEANPFLKDALKDKEVNFKILEGKDNDGKFCYDEYIKSEGKNVTIALDSSLFDESDKGKEMLAMTMSHELGHFIDFANRPLGYTGLLKDKEEFFADIIGAKMATNAGYEKSITAFKEYLGSKDNSLLKSRAQLLEERYPETKTEQNTKINSDRIAELRGTKTAKPAKKTTQTNITPNSVKLYKETGSR